MERDSGLIGTSLALQNLLLAAHAAGLGASGMTGPLVAADADCARSFACPPSWHDRRARADRLPGRSAGADRAQAGGAGDDVDRVSP